jgi:hypothetical protein
MCVRRHLGPPLGRRWRAYAARERFATARECAFPGIDSYKSLEPLEKVRRRATVVETLVKAMSAAPMERARDFDSRTSSLPRSHLGRGHEHPANTAPTSLLINHERRDPAPRPVLMCDRDEEVRRGSDDGAAIVGDEHTGPGISQKSLEPSA